MNSVEKAPPDSKPKLTRIACHVCGYDSPEGMGTYSLPFGVTSDCRPWPDPVAVAFCAQCGSVQAPANFAWRKKVNSIYEKYDTYKAAGGKEQKIAEPIPGGGLQARSEALVEWLSLLKKLPEEGGAIDIGCGRGSFLEAFGKRYPKWGLHGTEFDQKNSDLLRRIPGFQGLQTGGFQNISGHFDFLSMIHVLEHVEHPVSCLQVLREKAKPGALLLVQVPDWQANPFALAIADHATHFTPSSLLAVTKAAGWEAVMPVASVVPKELTLLVRVGKVALGFPKTDSKGEESLLVGRLDWLGKVLRKARMISLKARPFGIFGTAVAGTWLAEHCRDHLRFFVDEDPDRIGGEHLGVPIVSPTQVPQDADVLIGMSPQIADRLLEKYKDSRARFHGVPPLETS